MRLSFALRPCTASLVFVCLLVVSIPAFSIEWLPVTPEELAMKENPLVPGGHAALLYYAHDEDDKVGSKTQYFRIKIFSEEGKKFANIETPPYDRDVVNVESIKARTIRPDGTIVDFNGKIFDKVVSKRRGFRFMAKTFTIPDVQVGSIIEYRYTTRWDIRQWIVDPYFTVQHDLPMLKGHYRLKPVSDWRLAWVMFNLPASVQPKELNTHDLVMDAERIPGFDKEDFSPPEDELRARVQFFYFYSMTTLSIDGFWKDEVRKWSKTADSFMDKKTAMQAEVANITSPSDSSELKLRKIYDRVQKLRNLTYEESKTEEEAKRQFQDNKNVEDVLKHGYGYHNQLNRLFAALARAAGFQASVVRIAERDNAYFHKEIMSSRQLSSEVAVVNADGKQMYFAPGVPYCPFGLLSWEDSGAHGIAMGKELNIIQTPPPASEATVTTRKINATLDRDGNLSGNLEITFTGHKALELRLDARDADDTKRKKDIEDLVRSWLPGGANVELKSVNDWASSSPLVTTFSVSIPGFGTRTGKRMLVPSSMFTGAARNPFTKRGRFYPVHLKYAFRENDEISLTLPDGLQADSIPAPRQNSDAHGVYSVSREQSGNALKTTRRFDVNSVFIPAEEYEGLRSFYEKMRVGDDDQMVFKIVQGS